MSLFLKDTQVYVEYVHKVLELLQTAEMELKQNTCYFFSDFISYMGHVIVLGKLRAGRTTIDAIELL